MNKSHTKRQFGLPFRLAAFLAILAFSSSLIILPPKAHAQSVANLPAPGSMVTPSVSYNPTIVMGITIYPENPLQFDFIIDVGDDDLQGEELKKESKKLINYFLATLTVPKDEMWVNLSPYEKDRIVADGLGVTEMGRDMLAQDYLLKQLTASLMYPEENIGSEFWKQVYAGTQAKLGTTQVPMNTFNKIWIVPDRAVVYVNDNNIFVSESHLKIMLDEDYLALESNVDSTKHGLGNMTKNDVQQISEQAKEAIRKVLIPEIEREVNEGKNFANLRQIFNSMILATWYKNNLKESVLGNVYVNSNKTNGIELENKNVKEEIYNQYIEAFKKGVYNYIKEDFDESTQQIIPRKYFSGGANFTKINVEEPKGKEASSPVKERFSDEGPEYKIGVKLDMTDGFGEIVHAESSSPILDNSTDYGIVYDFPDANGDIFFKNDESTKTADGKMVVLRPIEHLEWANKYVLNPGIKKIKKKTYMAFRAAGDEAIPEGQFPKGRIGLAESEDGFKTGKVLFKPIFEPNEDFPYEADGVEDPRLERGFWRDDGFHRDEEKGDTIAMFYTAVSYGVGNQININAAMATIKIENFENYQWDQWVRHGILMSQPDFLKGKEKGFNDRNVVVAPGTYIIEGKEVYALYHRPWVGDDPTKVEVMYFPVGEGIRYSLDKGGNVPKKSYPFFGPEGDGWQSYKVGMGAFAREEEDGYVYVYHGVEEETPTTPRTYSVGEITISKSNPTKIVKRSALPHVQATEYFENNPDVWVANVAFPTGVVVNENTETLYYGAGDSVIVARTSPQNGNRFATGEIDASKWKKREYLAQAGLMPPEEMGLELAYNPATLMISENLYLIVYRGVKRNVSNEDGLRSDNTTEFYAAFSKDGIHIDEWIPDPIMIPGTNSDEQNSIEDPRLVLGFMQKEKFFPDPDGDTVVIFYVGFNINKRHRQIDEGGNSVEGKGQAIPLWATIPVESLKKKDFKKLKRRGSIDISIMLEGQDIGDVTENKDMTIFPEPVFLEVEEKGNKVTKKVIVVIDRPMNNRRNMNIRISWRDAQKGFDGPWNPDGEKILLRAEPGTWKETLGGGGTPVKTDYGWVFLYHGTEYIDNGFDYVIQTLEQELNNLEGNVDLSDLYHLTKTKLNEIKERKLSWEKEFYKVKKEISRLKSEEESFQKEEEDLSKLLNEAKLRIYRTGELLLDPTNILHIIEDNGPSITPHTVYDLFMVDGFLFHTFNDGDVLLKSGELASWRGSGDHTMDVLIGSLEDLFSKEALEQGRDLSQKVLNSSSSPVGGIDFNPNMLELSDQGQGINFIMDNSVLQNIQTNLIHGIQPVIINITPITNFMPLIGLSDSEDLEKQNLTRL